MISGLLIYLVSLRIKVHRYKILTLLKSRGRMCISCRRHRCEPVRCISKRPPHKEYRSSSGYKPGSPVSVVLATRNSTLWAKWPANCLATAIWEIPLILSIIKLCIWFWLITVFWNLVSHRMSFMFNKYEDHHF